MSPTGFEALLFGLCHVGFLEAEVTIFEVDVIS